MADAVNTIIDEAAEILDRVSRQKALVRNKLVLIHRTRGELDTMIRHIASLSQQLTGIVDNRDHVTAAALVREVQELVQDALV